MTWVLTTDGPSGGKVTATVRNPILGERWTDQRRQAAVESDGAEVYIQDLGITDQLLEVAWRDLNPREWSQLRRLLLQAGFRRQLIDVTFSGSEMPVPLSVGQTIDGVPLSVGQVPCYEPAGIGVGDDAFPDGGTLGSLQLEQSSVTFEHRLPTRGDITLVFRVPNNSQLQAGG